MDHSYLAGREGGGREHLQGFQTSQLRYSLFWNFPKEAGRKAHLSLDTRYLEPWVSILVASKPPLPKR